MTDLVLPLTRSDVNSHLDCAVDLEPAETAAPSLDQVADALSGLDVRPGEVVLIAMSNGTPLLRCFFGVLFHGGVPALVGAGTPSARIRSIAEKLGARTLIAPSGIAAYRGLPRRSMGTVDALRWEGVDPRFHDPGDVIILTSGTSGVLSGCLHRFTSLARNAARHAASVGLRASDTMLVNLPLNFSYALVAQAISGMMTGARLVVAGPPFTPAAYTRALTDNRVTSSSLTPFMVRNLLGGGWKPPASLRMLTVGGEALEEEVTRFLLARFPELEVYLTYGLTEAGPRVSTLAAHLEPPSRLASVGLPLPGVRASLRDVGEDGVGELLVSSDTVLRRKVGVEEGRASACFAGPQQIATGDLFRIEDGYLYFHGRLSDFVVTRGVKVSLSSVRRMAASVPGVVTSTTRSYTAEDGDTRFDIDLYLDDVSPAASASAKRSLLRRLMRTELPNRIRTLPAQNAGHK